MDSPKNIRIADFAYDLPDERIAKYPLAERDTSKLLIYNHGTISHRQFRDLPELLPEGSLLVMNNTRVIQARLHFRKETGALIEVFCLEPAEPHDYVLMFQQTQCCTWHCLVGNAKKWKGGALRRPITVEGKALTLSCERLSDDLIRFTWDEDDITWAQVLDACGELPIPPYLNRATEASDLKTYQTVYSKIKGSVAAPTAGLHFTPEVLADIDTHGIEREELTLHVGAGTFKPVKSEEIEGHEMHTEFISVRRETIQKLIDHEGCAIAVGTTSVRTLESLYYMGLKVMHHPNLTEAQLHVAQWEPYKTMNDEVVDSVVSLQALAGWMDRHHLLVFHSSTQIIIAPGYDYKIVKMLVTNFHQPQSTLLLLVSAFVKGDWHKIYDYALTHDFRFLSYGDSSLLIP